MRVANELKLKEVLLNRNTLFIGQKIQVVDGPTLVKGIVAEFFDNRFFIHNNEINGDRGEVAPSKNGYRYSWAMGYGIYHKVKYLEQKKESAKDFNKYCFNQQNTPVYWTTSTGEVLDISKMETQHITNCISMLRRQSVNDPKVLNTDKYKALTQEKRRRDNDMPIDTSLRWSRYSGIIRSPFTDTSSMASQF